MLCIGFFLEMDFFSRNLISLRLKLRSVEVKGRLSALFTLNGILEDSYSGVRSLRVTGVQSTLIARRPPPLFRIPLLQLSFGLPSFAI